MPADILTRTCARKPLPTEPADCEAIFSGSSPVSPKPDTLDQNAELTSLQGSHEPAPVTMAVRLLATSDLHGRIHPYDYYADQPTSGGLALAASLIDQLRLEADNVLLLDNGDFLQGNPLADFIAHRHSVRPDLVHPTIEAMNLLRYDGATLGNHEFNYGLEFLANCIDGANFPIVSANFALSARDPLLLGSGGNGDRALVPPFQILHRQFRDNHGQKRRLRIGLIGFLPPQIMIWDHPHLHGRASTQDIIEAAEAHLPRIKAAGADLVIALSHSGFGPAEHEKGTENASLALARVDGIDVILAGHSHKLFPSADFAPRPGLDPIAGTIHGKPATMPGFGASHVGIVDLTLQRRPDGWQMVSARSSVRPVPPATSATASPRSVARADIIRATAKAHAATIDYLRTPVGRSAIRLHSYFALVSSVAAIRLVAQAQSDHVRQALATSVHSGLPVLAAAAPFKAGGHGGPLNYTDIAPGLLVLRNVADLYIYPNPITALRLNGAQLAEWLERAVGLFHQLTPGVTGQRLLNPDFPSFLFDMIHGLTYGVDLTQPPRYSAEGQLINPGAHRISGLAFEAYPIDPEAEFILATNAHRAYGGGNFPGAVSQNVVYEGRTSNRDALMESLGSKLLRDDLPQPWHFLPLPGTKVLFETSPRACACLTDLAGFNPTVAGMSEQGFATLQLEL